MTDGVIKGTGNSWNLKSVPNFPALYPTYEALAQKIATDGVPVDLLLNAAGWKTQGTPLNKANLLKDATAKLYGKTAAAVPDEILADIAPRLTTAQNTASQKCQLVIGSYVGNGKFGNANPTSLNFSFSPKLVLVVESSETSRRDGWFAYPVTVSFIGDSNSNNMLSVTWGGNSLSWYNTHSSILQFNGANKTYHYTAIG